VTKNGRSVIVEEDKLQALH